MIAMSISLFLKYEAGERERERMPWRMLQYKNHTGTFWSLRRVCISCGVDGKKGCPINEDEVSESKVHEIKEAQEQFKKKISDTVNIETTPNDKAACIDYINGAFQMVSIHAFCEGNVKYIHTRL